MISILIAGFGKIGKRHYEAFLKSLDIEALVYYRVVKKSNVIYKFTQ